VRLVARPDRLEIWAGEPDVGQGTVPSLARIAAETLGLDVGSVDVVLGDTEHGPFGHGAFSSRTTFFTGNALLDGCLRLRERARELADELGIEDGGPLAVATELEARGLPLDPLVVSGRYVCDVTDVYGPSGEGNRSPTYGFAVHGCRVRVDRWTGAVTVERYWTMHDAGAVIWPAGAIGQVVGGVLHAAGQALSERVRRTPDGRMANPGFLDYRLPTSTDAFPVEAGFARSHDAQGPLGAKAIGELPLIPVAAALANAIHDATGARVLEAPMEPEAVLRAITEGHTLR
jgi:CO/xanthine dehydrogenase Mo-binding subunit